MNVYGLKGARGFNSKFPFDYVIIFEDSLSDLVVVNIASLIVFQESIIYQCFSIVTDAMRGKFIIMSWENPRAPKLAFSTIEIVGLIVYIVVEIL